MVVWSILFFFAVTFLTISIVVVVAWMAMQRIASNQPGGESAEAAEAEPFPVSSPLFKTETLSTISIWHQLLAQFDFVEGMKARIAEADLNWSVGRLTSLMLLNCAVALAVAANLAWVPLWAGLLGSGLAAAAPYLYVLRRRSRRFAKFQEGFPDALDSLARSLRAGYPFAASLDVVAVESPAPVSTEMRKTFIEANLGMPWDRALANLARRVPLLEVNLFVAAVQLHSRTGGKLSEVVSGLAENMRENVALVGEVRSMAAHGKLTGIVLTIVPIAIMGIMAYVSPAYVRVLVDHPYGKHLIAAAVTCLILAHFVIRKIVEIKI
jgi:tight adherence protein B